MKVLATICLLFFLNSARAQQAVISAGGDAAGSAGSISYSIGQVAYSNSGNTSLNEGVQQPFELFLVALNESHQKHHINIYPNPTSAELVIDADVNSADLTASFFDAQGMLLEKVKLQSPSTRISVSKWAAATYLISITDSQGTASSYQLVKH